MSPRVLVVAELRRSLAAQALDGAVGRARPHAQRLRAGERRDLDLGARERLGDREGHLDLDVLAFALEDRRGSHVGDDVEIARRPAARPGLALAGQADARALLDARRDVDAVALERAHRPRAVAGRAGILDHGARAAAARAGLGDREHALALGLDPAALAAWADLRRGAGLRAGPVAGRAQRLRGDRERDLRAGDRLLEGDRYLCLEVLSALGTGFGPRAATARRPSEEVGEDVAHAGGVLEVEVPKAPEPAAGAGVRERAAAAVVLLALLGVREHVVGLGDLLEARLGLLVVGVAVGVVLARELAVGLLDLLGRRLLLDAERRVVVAGGPRGRHHAPLMPRRRRARVG